MAKRLSLRTHSRTHLGRQLGARAIVSARAFPRDDHRVSVIGDRTKLGREENRRAPIFANDYTALFASMLRLTAREMNVDLSEDTIISADVSFMRTKSHGYGVVADLTVQLPDIRSETAIALLSAARTRCFAQRHIRREVVDLGIRLAR